MTFKEKFLEEYNRVKLVLKEKRKNIKYKFTFKDRFNKFKMFLMNIKFLHKVKEKLDKLREHKYLKFAPLILIIVIMMMVGFLVGSGNTSKDKIINDFSAALENGNAKELTKILKVVNYNNKELTQEDVKPLISFYSEDKGRITSIKTALKDNKSLYSTKLISEKKLIGEKYYIGVQFKQLDVSSNVAGAKVLINGEDKGTLSKNKTAKFNLISPGKYTIELEKTDKYATLKQQKDINLTKEIKVDIPLKGAYINVNSNFNDAKVYINEKDTGLLVKDFKNIGPFPTDGSYNLAIKYKTPWGEIASNIVKITDIPDINLNLDVKSSAVEGSINSVMEKFYKTVFEALEADDKNKISMATDEVKNKIYETIKQNAFLFKNNYKVNKVNIDFDKSVISYENNKYIANIVVNLDYNVKKEIFGVPLKSQNYNENFFTKIRYEDGNWIVDDIEGFNLKNIE